MTAITQHQDLIELRGLLAKATPELTSGTASVRAMESLLRAGYLGQKPRARNEPNYAEDAALIAAAVNALPSLLDHIDRLTEDNVRLMAQVAGGVGFADVMEGGGCDYTRHALAKHLCCCGFECGCQGTSVGHYLAWQLRQALTPAASEGK